jgi:hypothetical protein
MNTPSGSGGPTGGAGPDRTRHDERFGVPVNLRVNGGHEPGATPWEEVTITRDASAGGASFLVDHPVSVGDVLRLQILPPLPETFGAPDLKEPSPPAYAVVRSSVPDSRRRRVGVKFFNDVEGLMPARAPVPPLGTDERRERERYVASVHFLVQKVDAAGAVVAEALTVAENVSEGGAQLLGPLPVKTGDRVVVWEAGGRFVNLAEVRHALVEEGGLRRMNVVFLDGRGPTHLFPPRP